MNTYYHDFDSFWRSYSSPGAYNYAKKRSLFGHNVRLVRLSLEERTAPRLEYRVYFSAVKPNLKQALSLGKPIERDD